MGSFAMSATSAACFAGGGLLIKPGAGIRRMWPSVAAVLLLVTGAVLLAVSVDSPGEVGSAHLALAGLQMLLVVVLGILIFDARPSAPGIGAVVLVITATLLVVRGI